ncbi:undecaprenyl-diphosphate phosphatase [Frigoriglobus tundricola]|uniref:undecaprenyl-diphosphate phosphatase n=1 Tax=Frigoriglobus tundricola TaxID=2774151 RepID=UPI0036F2229F
MPIWEAVLLGVIQGVTEFLPISSTAHLLIARSLLDHQNPEDAFTVVIQLGTLAAVFVYFRADIARMLNGLWADVRARRLASTPDSRLGWLIVLGTVPAVVVGFLFKKQLKATFFNPASIATVSIAFALLMLAAEWWAHRRARTRPPPRRPTSPGSTRCGSARGRRARSCPAGRGRAPPSPAGCSRDWRAPRRRGSRSSCPSR